MGIKLIGRPRKYSTEEELREKIQHYFDSITIDEPKYERVNIGTKDDPEYTKEPILNNAGEHVIEIEFIKQPSVVGMCLFLGIHRDTLCEYEKNPIFTDTIREAKQIIVNQKLEMLPLMKNPRGLMFDLSANYGMHEKQEIDLNNKKTVIVGDIDE